LLTLTQEEEVRLVIEECHEHWGLMQQIFEYVGRPVLFVFSLLQFPTSTSALLFAPPPKQQQQQQQQQQQLTPIFFPPQQKPLSLKNTKP
jgi:hypothetical protein